MIKLTPKFLIITALIYCLGLVYLLLPSPLVPTLSDSKKSLEPGDTWQNPDQSAFFTDKNRSQVLTELQSKFSLHFSNFSLPSFRLNYRPEEVEEFVRVEIPSYYLEEIIHPLRESLYVNGWEPQNSPIYKDFPQKERPEIIIDGTKYRAKITLKPVFSNLVGRVIVWTLAFPCLYLLALSWQKTKNES